MAALGVRLVKLPFNCCGNPSRGKNLEVSVFSAIKNLALARKYGLDIMTPCKCCFGQLKHGVYWYETRSGTIRNEFGLKWDLMLKLLMTLIIMTSSMLTDMGGNLFLLFQILISLWLLLHIGQD